MAVEKSITIGQLLKQYPDVAEILLGAGMHCLGCPASQMESIEQACAVHNIDCDALMAKLNEQIK